MKVLAWLGGVIVALVVGIYVIAFTSIGNSIVGPIIEGKIKEQTKLDSKLSTFSLSMSDFDILLHIDADNSVSVKGQYSLMTQVFSVVYNVDMNKLETLKPLTNAPLVGSFSTLGTVRGDMAFIEVDGASGVASSETSYHVELTNFNPTSIIAKIKDADVEALLALVGEKPYASAKLNIDVDFKDITPKALDGKITLSTTDGILNTKLMNKDFEINVPKTDFTMNLDADLKGEAIDYTYIFNSNLAKLASNGNVVPQPLKTDIKYSVDVSELAVLKPLTGADVRGAFRLNGTVIGDKKELVVDGKSDFAASDTTFRAVLNEFAPASLNANMKNLKLAKVLYMVKQPHYADGVFSLDVDINDLRAGKLNGTVVSNVKNGLVDSKYMTKAYEFKTRMPKTKFSLNTNTKLNGDIVDTKVNLKSTLANFDVKQARFDIKDSSIKTDYKATVHNLNRLYFATERHLKGSIVATGEFKQAKDLDLTMHSKIANGVVDVKLHNDNLHADLKSLQTLAVLDMLIYPEVFKSSLSGVLDYNLAKAKGTFKGDLTEGKFTKNTMLTLVKKYGKLDLYKEKFKGDVSADINKEKIVASLDLKSNKSSITTKNTKLNSKTKKINSTIKIVANENPITVKLTGNTASPKVEIDAKDIMKSQAKKHLLKELNKKDSKAAKILEKNPEINNLLKSFF